MVNSFGKDIHVDCGDVIIHMYIYFLCLSVFSVFVELTQLSSFAPLQTKYMICII